MGAARPFWTVLLSAIFVGLIALMVWLLPSSNIRLLVIVFIAYVVAIGKFSHIIAGLRGCSNTP